VQEIPLLLRKRKEIKMNFKGINKGLLILIIVTAIVLIAAFTGCSMDQLAAPEGKGFYEEGEPVIVEEAATSRETPQEDLAATEEEIYEEETRYSDTADIEERKVIKTAYIDLEVGEGKFEKIVFDITRLAEKNGGFVSHTSSYSDSEGNLTGGNVTIRIPHDRYNSALDVIKEMGTVKSISVSGQDVTQEYTDLESRLRNMEAQEEVLLELMAESDDVSDSIEVQRELSNVQEQIEIIKGRMNYLDNMVSLSTIEVYLHEPEPISEASGWGFIEALKKGLRGAVTVFNFVVVFIIAASPLIVLIAIIIIIIWLIVRSRRRKRERIDKK
jgi:hypothetical protein